MTPTARTIQRLKEAYPLVQRVEQWIPGIGIRRDLFGIGDVLAIRADEVLLVQATTGPHLQHRLAKLRANPALAVLCGRGWKVQVWGWRKVGPRNGRKTWAVRILDACTP